MGTNGNYGTYESCGKCGKWQEWATCGIATVCFGLSPSGYPLPRTRRACGSASQQNAGRYLAPVEIKTRSPAWYGTMLAALLNSTKNML